MSRKQQIEKDILGSILLDNAVLADAISRLQVSDFSEGFHRNVYQSMLILKGRQYSIDPINILEEMKRQETFDATCSSITNLTFGVADFVDLGAKVQELLDVNAAIAAEGEWPEVLE